MTRVEFFEHGAVRKMEISGHSDFAQKGSDIVCGGVSALSQAYAYYMSDLADKGKACIDSLMIMDGYLEIYSRNDSPEARAAYEMTKQGIEAISEEYPDFVSIFLKKI